MADKENSFLGLLGHDGSLAVIREVPQEEHDLRICPVCNQAGLETDPYVWLPKGVTYEKKLRPRPPAAFKLRMFCNFCRAEGFVSDPAAPAYEVAMLIYLLDHGQNAWEAFRDAWELGHYHPKAPGEDDDPIILH